MAIFLQIIGAFFSAFMLYICFTHYKRGEFKLGDIFLWGILWVVLLLLVLFPNRYELLFGALKIQGALQFIMIVSIGVLYTISFFSYTRSRRNELRLQRLISKLAVEEYGGKAGKISVGSKEVSGNASEGSKGKGSVDSGAAREVADNDSGSRE